MSQLLKCKGGAHFEWIHNERLPRLEETVIEEALRNARRMIKNKEAKDIRERDYGFFQDRKEVGYNAIKVYGNSPNPILLGYTIYPDGKTVIVLTEVAREPRQPSVMGASFLVNTIISLTRRRRLKFSLHYVVLKMESVPIPGAI